MDLEAIAAELTHARESRRVVDPPSSRGERFTLDDGYAVGAMLHARAIANGFTQAGVKLGFTNQAVWDAVGLDRPFWSPVYAETITTSPTASLAAFVEPRIEPEIVVGLDTPLNRGASREHITAAIGWAAVGFEIVHCHYRNWEMAPADAIADGGLHGCLVVGEHHAIADHVEALADVEVSLRRDGQEVATGRGANALGGPLEAIHWLLQLPGVSTLPPGSVITTGTLTDAFPIRPGQTWRLATGGSRSLGELSLQLVDD